MRTTPRTNTPTHSRCVPPSCSNAPTASCPPASTIGCGRNARVVVSNNTIQIGRFVSSPRDGVAANTHPLNVAPDGTAPPVERIPLYEVYMRMAEELAKRSTCARLQVGTVVTDQRLENVLAIGYNGNARGLPNKCDSTVPGNCGCIHSEMNALVKAPGNVRDKVVFVSACMSEIGTEHVC